MDQADAINQKIPADRRDAFYELVLYPVRMAAMTNEVFICAGLNAQYVKANDATANDMANRVEQALAKIDSETKYFNDELVGGKWKNYMTARGTTSPSWVFKWPGVTRLPNVQHAANEPITLGNPFSTPMLAPRGATISGPAQFVEKDGYVSIAAEHFTRNIPRSGAQWQIISGLGRVGDSVSVYPTTVASIEKPEDIVATSPELDYDMTMTTAEDVDVTTYNIPTRRINDARGLRYAIAIDDETPQIVDFNEETEGSQWMQNVARNAAINSTKHKIDAPGKHTLKIWMVDPGVVMEKIVVNAGGVKESYFGPPETVAGVGQ
jgi:hypothetical protein